jgi:hypothetical protein
MTSDTKELIRELTGNVTPVRRTGGPAVRSLAWLALSAAYISAFVLIMPARHDVTPDQRGPLFMIEQAAAIATAIASAIAAFTSVVPGYSRKWAVLPVVPLVIWLASLGPGCVQEWNRSGIQHLPIGHNPWCFPFIVLFGAVPAAAITIMLRRGAPLTPRLTATLGGLAAAGMANAGVRIVHPEDVSIMLLFWHAGGVMALSALAAASGRRFFNWSLLISKSNADKPKIYA